MPNKAFYGDISSLYLPSDTRQNNFKFIMPANTSGADSAKNAIPVAFQNKEVFKNSVTQAFNKVSFISSHDDDHRNLECCLEHYIISSSLAFRDRRMYNISITI